MAEYKDLVVSAGGTLDIAKGDVATNITVDNGGKLSVTSGGVLSSATVAEAKDLTIGAKATVSDLTVSASVTGLTVSSGATISGLNYSGAFTKIDIVNKILQGAKVYDFNINGPGHFYISSGTTIFGGSWGGQGLTGNSGGYIKGSALNAVLSNVTLGGVSKTNAVWIRLIGAKASGKNVTVEQSARFQVSAGTTYDTVLSGGIQLLYANAKAYNTVMSGGSMEIRHGIAYDTQIFSGGTQVVGCSASGGTVVGSGSAIRTVVHFGGAVKVDSGLASDTVVSSGGAVHVVAGLASDTVVSSGGAVHVSGGVASDTQLDGGRIIASSGASVSGTVINSGGSMDVVAGASVSGTVINSGGYLNINDGAGATPFAVSGTVISSGGSMLVSRGNTAVDTVVYSGGQIRLLTSVGVTNLQLKAGGILGAFSFAEDKVFNKAVKGAALTVSENITYSALSMTVGKGAVAKDITIHSGGRLSTADGSGTGNSAMVSNTVINSGGYMIVSRLNSAVDTVVYSGGRIYLYGSGAVTNLQLKEGGILGAFSFAEDKVFNKTTVSGAWLEVANKVYVSGGTLRVSSGGIANDITVHSAGTMNISSGGAANKTIVNSGAVHVCGGTVNDTVVNSNGAVYVSGGAANNTVLNNGATISTDAAATDVTIKDLTICGDITVDNSASITKFITGNLTFDLSGDTDGDAAAEIQNDWLADEIAITVKADALTAGTFALVGASTIEKLTLQLADGNIYQVTAGNSVYDAFAGLKYTVSAVEGALTFAVAEEEIAAEVVKVVTSETTLAGCANNYAEFTGDFGTAEKGGTVFAGTGLTDNGWLVLDDGFADASTKQNGKVYGGGASGNIINGAVNIKAEGAKIGNLLGGGAAGSTDNNINIEIGNATVAAGEGDSTETKETTIKALYGGGHGNVEGNINIGINGGKITSQLVGGTVRTTGSANVAGEIKLSITDIDLTDADTDVNIIGGSYINFTKNATSASVGSVSISFAGGTAGDQTTGTGAKVYGGGYAYSTADGIVDETIDYTVTNGVTIDISGGTLGSRKNGSGIFGGVFAAKVEAEVENGVSITLSGADTVAGNIFGGGWAQQGGVSNVTGGVSITIESGIANVIYGGGAHSTSGGSTTVDSVDITVKGGSAKAIYAGGQTAVLDGEVLKGDIVTGDAAITVTGSFSTATNFYGTGWNKADTVLGKSTLNFADYTGEVTGAIANFDEVILSGNTVATLNGVIDAVAALTIDLTGRTENGIFAALGADSTVAAIDLKADAGFAAGKDTWEIVTTTGAKISDFDLFIGDAAEAIDLTVGTALTSGVFNGWGISEVTDAETGTVTYKFGIIA